MKDKEVISGITSAQLWFYRPRLGYIHFRNLTTPGESAMVVRHPHGTISRSSPASHYLVSRSGVHRPSRLVLVDDGDALAAHGLIASTYVPSYGGLYVVMINDATWQPLPCRPIYVGKAQDLSLRVCRSHEKYQSWLRAASGTGLFIAFCHIEDENVRSDVERRLIEHYTPSCNRMFNRNAARFRVLGDLA